VSEDLPANKTLTLLILVTKVLINNCCGLKYILDLDCYKAFVLNIVVFIRWFEFGLLKLHDMEQDINLEIYTQSVPVPTSIVELISDDTPNDYEHIATGLSIPVSHFMASNLKVII